MAKSPLEASVQSRISRSIGYVPSRLLLVTISNQALKLIENGAVVRQYPVSTSQWGVGNREGSNQTPLGLHRIHGKFGDGAPPGRIFESRNDTGRDWNGGTEGENLILSRILRLEGLEPGVNRGDGIDSYERYIYIHGTSKEDLIGTPLSHGCVCMRNHDVIDLFDMVEEGTFVFIDQ
ncbi:MAG: L,D-transpeptidase family protein [Chitinivibrionales bacterium]|nr:L,D-transpeptidase family protein [Chitinivibrionales bacterium]MBD3355647.1 L,D-transpeptidase family protein [Chitinivibrionales bacterium]